MANEKELVTEEIKFIKNTKGDCFDQTIAFMDFIDAMMRVIMRPISF